MKYLDVDLHKQIKFSLRSGYRRVLFVVFSIGLLGCGGGGGSDPANQPSPPVGNPDPITPPSEPQGLTLVMDTETAGAAGYAVGLSEGVVQFSQFALEHLAYATSPEQRAVQTCYKDNIEQGSVSFTHIDKNIDYRISSGDEFVLEFNDCWNEVLEASADGQFRALIKDFEPYQNHHFLLSAEISTQTFSITNPDDTNPIILSGNFFAALEVDHLVYEESITVSGLETSQSFSVNVEGITEKISEFKVSKRNQATDDTYRDSTQTGQFNILVDSEAAGGRFRCEASQLVYEGKDPFRGQAPLSADVECKGKESAVQLKDNDVLLDPNGSGEFELIGTLLWAEIIEGYWYRDATYLDNDQLQTWFSGWLPIGTFSLDWTDVAYDQYTDRLLFITSDNDPQYPRALVAYSGDTRRFVLLKTFDAEVSQLAVTAFGEQYCIAEKNEAAISCYSSDDFNETQRSVVTFDAPFDPRFDLSEAEFDAAATVICELVADPNAPRRLAVTLTKTGLPCAHNLVLVENGQQLSESLLEMSANIGYNILLESNATVAFMDDGHSIRMYGLRLGFDGGGFSGAEFVPTLETDNHSRHLWNNGGRLYWGCNVWDSLTGSLLGQYEGIDCDNFYLDDTSLYGLKQADNEQSYELMIYDKESFVPQALYGNFWNPGSTKQSMGLKGTKEVLFFLEAGKTALHT